MNLSKENVVKVSSTQTRAEKTPSSKFKASFTQFPVFLCKGVLNDKHHITIKFISIRVYFIPFFRTEKILCSFYGKKEIMENSEHHAEECNNKITSTESEENAFNDSTYFPFISQIRSFSIHVLHIKENYE
jgi:hypothetical protein